MNTYLKKVTVISILVILFLTVYMFAINTNVATAEETSTEETVTFAGGTGTSEDPYIIETKAQLNAVRNNLTASYKLGNDITFQKSDFGKNGAFYNEGKRWEPIGSSSNYFSGSFDGDGHCISGIIIEQTDNYSSCGLFAFNEGLITNLAISNFTITGSGYCGGIAANNIGNIHYCSCNGFLNFEGSNSEAGAICGMNCGNIKGCFNSADIVAAGGVAGIAYIDDSNLYYNTFYYGQIEQCYNSGKIESISSSAGGIVYINKGNGITNCFNSGDILSDSCSTAGIAVKAGSYAISNCYNIGSVIEGGISTTLYYGYGSKYFENCYSLDTCDECEDEYGTVCTLKEMMKKSTYGGFDFDSMWEFDEKSDYKFPTLRGLENHAIAPTENKTDFEGGYGTKSYPYIVKTKTQLNNVRKELNACFRLDSDIIFEESDFEEGGDFYNDGKGWEPIGNSDEKFWGCFDGNGHTIESLKIDRPDGEYVGMFGYSNGIIKNLKLKGEVAKGGFCIGGIIGCQYTGKVSNCEVDGIVEVYRSDNGGTGYAGGISGCSLSYDATINSCVNKATISSDKKIDTAEIGGIIGYAKKNINITKCVNYGYLQCNGDYGGGIVGSSERGEAKVQECINYGTVQSNCWSGTIGGIAGTSYQTEIRGCVNVGNIIGTSTSGGISGFCGFIYESYNAGSVTSYALNVNASAGGIMGKSCYQGEINNCYNVGIVDSWEKAGGIIGDASSEKQVIQKCYNAGTVSSKSGTVGGIAGSNTGSITDSFYLDTLDKGVGSGSDAGTKCTAEQLQNADLDEYSDVFGEAFDFDYDMIWAISDTAEYKYPVLIEVINPEFQYTLSAETRDGVAETPIAKTYGNGKITVNATSGQMYVCLTQDKSMSVIPSFSSSEWKKATSSTLTFDGLEAGTTYEIYTYVPANGSQKASYVSQALVITLLQVGDPTGDGNIDFIDALYMKRALAGWDGYTINFSACDVDGNGEINDADVMYLERHIAGWKDCANLPKTTDNQTASA